MKALNYNQMMLYFALIMRVEIYFLPDDTVHQIHMHYSLDQMLVRAHTANGSTL